MSGSAVLSRGNYNHVAVVLWCTAMSGHVSEATVTTRENDLCALVSRCVTTLAQHTQTPIKAWHVNYNQL